MAGLFNLTILKGETFSKIIRWESSTLVSKPISAITQATPVRVTATAHAMPTGWRAAIVSAGGMLQINATKFPPKQSEFFEGTVVDPNTIDFKTRNSGSYSPYTTGGFLVYRQPQSLVGYTARMDIRATVNDTAVLKTLNTSNGGITLDSANSTITLLIPATETDDFTWSSAVYDLELVSGSGVVTRILEGSVQAVAEVTRLP